MNSQLRKNLLFNTAGSLLFYLCQAALNLLVTALAYWSHRGNIDRLKRNRENKLDFEEIDRISRRRKNT